MSIYTPDLWIGSYQKGVAPTIDTKRYKSLNEILLQSFAKYSEFPAFHCMGKTVTYNDLNRLSERFASYLQNKLNLKRGDRLAIMMPNILQYPIALMGALRAGVTVVNVNPLYTPRELEHQLKDSGAKVIVILENFANVLEKVLSKVSIEKVITTQLGDLLDFPKSLLVNVVVKKVKKLVPPWQIENSISFKDALNVGSGRKLVPPDMTQSDIAFLQYTGGTTGVAKGAILTHGNIIANILQAREWLTDVVVPGKEVMITPLPLYHIFSLTANLFIFSVEGALNVLIPNPRDLPAFVKELKKWKFTAMTGLNTLFIGLMNQPDFANLDFSRLKVTLGGGMAVQRAVAERWKKITGKPISEAYGLTETSPAACINPLDAKDFSGFIGLPIPSTEVSIRDDDGKEVPLGESGEICIRGPQVMQGYWNRPDETAKVMTNDGFFKTGDMGFMNEQGFIKLVDRKKDMILVSGFNVYPNEIEDVAAMHPKVLESAAVGVPSEQSGEIVKLFVVKKDQSLTQEELIKFCREHLTGYKVPKQVEFRDSLPKTNVGKILRRELRN